MDCLQLISKIAANVQVLPMVVNFIIICPELLPGFFIKLNSKN